MTLFDASFLGSPEAFAHPYPRYRTLRAKRGPFQFAQPSATAPPEFAWALMGHAEVQAALDNRLVFAPQRDTDTDTDNDTARLAFTPAVLVALRPWVTQCCEQLAAPLRGDVDVMAAYARELLPLCLDHLTQPGVAPWDTAVRAVMQAHSLQRPAAHQALVAAVRAADASAKHLLGNTLALLAEHPPVAQAVRDAPALAAQVVRESWRLETPLQRAYRRTTMDVGVGAALIPQGSTVVLFHGAANRDPSVWTEPERLKLDRPEPPLPVGYAEAPLARLLTESTLHVFASRRLALQPAAAAPSRQRGDPNLLGYSALPLRIERL